MMSPQPSFVTQPHSAKAGQMSPIIEHIDSFRTLAIASFNQKGADGLQKWPQFTPFPFVLGTSSVRLPEILTYGLLSPEQVLKRGLVSFRHEMSVLISPNDDQQTIKAGSDTLLKDALREALISARQCHAWSTPTGYSRIKKLEFNRDTAHSDDHRPFQLLGMAEKDVIAVCQRGIDIEKSRLHAWGSLNEKQQRWLTGPFPVIAGIYYFQERGFSSLARWPEVRMTRAVEPSSIVLFVSDSNLDDVRKYAGEIKSACRIEPFSVLDRYVSGSVPAVKSALERVAALRLCAVDDLVETLKRVDGDGNIQKDATRKLEGLCSVVPDPSKQHNALIGALNHPIESVRNCAMLLISRQGLTRAVPQLEYRLTDSTTQEFEQRVIRTVLKELYLKMSIRGWGRRIAAAFDRKFSGFAAHLSEEEREAILY